MKGGFLSRYNSKNFVDNYDDIFGKSGSKKSKPAATSEQHWKKQKGRKKAKQI